MDSAPGVLISAFLIVIALMLGVVLLDSFAVTGAWGETTRSGSISYDAARLNGTGSYVSYGERAGNNETVYQTTGFAMQFSGSSSSELSGTGWTLGNDTTWHASVWAQPHDGATAQTMKIMSISDGELIIYYNGSASEWAAWYYNQSGRQSYEASVATVTPTNGLTNIQVRANGTHLSIYRNNTVGDEVSIQGVSSVDAPTEAGNWNGTVEELRTFNESLASADRQTLIDQPAEQRPGLGRTMRVMFDQPNTTSELVLLAGGTATASDISYVGGFPADVMQRKTLQNDMAGTSDYRWTVDGPSISPVTGGELDGAPVAYASYDVRVSDPPLGVELSSLVQWIQIAAILPLLITVVYVLSKSQEF